MNNGDDCLILIVLDNEVILNLLGMILCRSYIDFINFVDRLMWKFWLVNILSIGNIIEEDDSNFDSGSRSSLIVSEGMVFFFLE